MIITCINCNKKFDINSELIPKIGRELVCGSCNHQWFFKNNTQTNPPKIKETSFSTISKKSSPSEKEEIIIKQSDDSHETLTKDKFEDVSKEIKKKVIKKNNNKKETINDIKKKKSNNFLNLIIVLIVTFAALVILVDTFKNPISKIVPNIEFILYNLYESIKDIKLFLNDLI